MGRIARTRQCESGVVSLIVALVMMIVITLIVLGFAEVARNEQRSSLDAQLSTQAYYAAESGVNDARAIIDDDIKNNKSPTDNLNSNCSLQGEYASLNNIINSQHNVSYTCLQVDTHPSALTYSIGSGSTIVPLLSAGGAFPRFDFTWTTVGDSSYCPSSGSPNTFTDAGSWSCPAPVVRIDLLNANTPILSRANWNSTTATIFFTPFSSSVANVGTTSDHGVARGARCTGKYTTVCTASICLNTTCSIPLGTAYYARITTIYVESSVELSISAAGIKFNGAQAVIDTTGKAQDVLRRVRVAADLTDANAYAIPNGAIISADSVCKRFGVTNTSFSVFDTVNNDLKSGGGGNLFCDPATSNPGKPS